MKIKSIDLEIVCGITSKLPETDKVEIAFAGKSNVGKSSLINALMNRKSFARTSATPGKTQTINFYNINDIMYLVDLPGYGYAKVSEKEKIQWGKLIERYLHSSKQLKAVFLLIDIRHDPSANDKMMYEWIVSQGYNPIIIATKLDKLKRSQVAKHVKMIKQGLDLVPGTQIIPFSSVSKQGREEIWELVEKNFLNETEVGYASILESNRKSGFQPDRNHFIYRHRNKIVVVFYAICHRVVYCIYCEPACVLAGKAVKDCKKARVGNYYHCSFGRSSQCTVLWNQ